MLVELGGNKVILEAGDSVFYDSSLPHAMYALDADAKFIAVVIK
jgi:quercetin dioxygenase-like cupin family protein